ncbi:MAG TPA: hypothetical protein VGL10_04140 [Gammaproteobacteria bacterium]
MNSKNGFLGIIILLLAANLIATVWSRLGSDNDAEAITGMALPLPKIISPELKEELLEEFIDDFNDGDFENIYAMLGPAAQTKVSEEELELKFEKLAELFDSIEAGAFSHSLLAGMQGNTRIYQLYYDLRLSEDSEFGERGILAVTLAVEGEDYQIYDLSLNAGAYANAS